MILGWICCILAAGVTGGLLLVLSLKDFPMWLDVIVWGSAIPVFILMALLYVGGIINGFRTIFKGDEKPTKSADA